MRAVCAIWAVVLLLSACGTEPAADRAEAAGETVPVPDWLRAAADADPAAASCAVRYPDDLPEQPLAFDATVVGVRRGVYDENAAGTPVVIEMRVNEVFNGALEPTVEVRTWDFAPPGRTHQGDPVGVRLLAAMSEQRDLMSCGFTRPYSKADAAAWRTAFKR